MIFFGNFLLDNSLGEGWLAGYFVFVWFVTQIDSLIS